MWPKRECPRVRFEPGAPAIDSKETGFFYFYFLFNISSCFFPGCSLNGKWKPIGNLFLEKTKTFLLLHKNLALGYTIYNIWTRFDEQLAIVVWCVPIAVNGFFSIRSFLISSKKIFSSINESSSIFFTKQRETDFSFLLWLSIS